jgi:hypothetical protein
MENEKNRKPRANWYGIVFCILILGAFMIILGSESSTTPVPPITLPQVVTPAAQPVPSTDQGQDQDTTDQTDDESNGTVDVSSQDASYMQSLQDESHSDTIPGKRLLMILRATTRLTILTQIKTSKTLHSKILPFLINERIFFMQRTDICTRHGKSACAPLNKNNF